MKQVFADTQFFIALINVKDQGRRQVAAAGPSLRGVTLVTTEEVLTEVLTFFAGRGRHLRELAAASVDRILAQPGTIVLAQSHDSFLDGFAFYKARQGLQPDRRHLDDGDEPPRHQRHPDARPPFRAGRIPDPPLIRPDPGRPVAPAGRAG